MGETPKCLWCGRTVPPRRRQSSDYCTDKCALAQEEANEESMRMELDEVEQAAQPVPAPAPSEPVRDAKVDRVMDTGLWRLVATFPTKAEAEQARATLSAAPVASPACGNVATHPLYRPKVCARPLGHDGPHSILPKPEDYRGAAPPSPETRDAETADWIEAAMRLGVLRCGHELDQLVVLSPIASACAACIEEMRTATLSARAPTPEPRYTERLTPEQRAFVDRHGGASAELT